MPVTFARQEATAETDVCGCCGAPAEVLFKSARKRDTWLIRQCDDCRDWLCSRCGNVDAEGVISCSNCIQDAAHRERVAEPAL